MASLATRIKQWRNGTDAPGEPGARWQAELRAFLELFVLCGFAIAQPVLDVTGRSPDFFLFNQASRADILLLAAAVTLLPALAAWAGELLVGLLLGRGPRRVAHLALVAGLLTVIAVEVGKKLLPLRGKRLALLALLAGLAATWLLATRPTLKLWLRYLAPAPLVFVLVFALASPAASLVRPHREAPVAGAAGAMNERSAHPVVMVFFDEFPMPSLLDHRGRIDARMYPNFARLASGATWFRNATAVNGYTPYAVPAMLTGRYPAKAVAPIYTQYPQNLFTLLAKSHDLKVSELVTRLCPPRLCPIAAAARRDTGVDVLAKETARLWTHIALPYDTQPDPDAQFVEETAGATEDAPPAKAGKLSPGFLLKQGSVNQPSRFTQFLDAFQANERPTFHFVHMMLPHTPWRYLPSGMQYPYPTAKFGRANSTTWGTEPWPVIMSHQRLLLQVAFTDHLIGQMIDRLKQVGLYDDALIVVTADHGISFAPGQHTRAPAKGTAQDTAWVPLFIKQPGQTAGNVTDRNWEHVDLVPTVADVLGIQVPWRVDGISALGSQTRTGTQKVFYSNPGAANRIVLDGPSNLALALRGETDRLLRPQDGRIGLYEIGRYGRLVGKSPAAVGMSSPSSLQATITKPTDLLTIDPSSGKVPAMVTGSLDGSTTVRAAAVAVAVNGTIGGVSEVYRNLDTPSFAAMVPDFLFRQDDNRIELFEVDASSGTPRLRPIRWHQ